MAREDAEHRQCLANVPEMSAHGTREQKISERGRLRGDMGVVVVVEVQETRPDLAWR